MAVYITVIYVKIPPIKHSEKTTFNLILGEDKRYDVFIVYLCKLVFFKTEMSCPVVFMSIGKTKTQQHIVKFKTNGEKC